MADRLKIALAQMNQRVGDLAGNAAAMLDMRRQAKGADLLLCPELQIVGYPPEDLGLEPVCAHLAELGAELFLVPHGSPYELDKNQTRERLARARTTSTGLPLVFLNRVGGQDELAFDGSSFVMHPDGEIVVQMPDWDEDFLITEWVRGADGWRCETRSNHELDSFPADVYRAMVVALRDYVGRNGFPGVILGLSGGIDSARSAATGVD